MEFNDLKFGNPNRKHITSINTNGYLDTLLDELSSYPPLENESKDVLLELDTLVKYTDFLEQDEKLKKKFDLYDSDFENYMIERLINQGVEQDELISLVKEIHNDIVPLLIKLKYKYNRIRPYQLAYYRKVELNPFKSKSSDSPSYPSGHCFQVRIYVEVIGNKYPKYYQALQELAADIIWSRLYMGLHYPSDNEFALYASECVLKHPEFIKKYKL